MTPSPYAIGGTLGLLNTFAFATASRGLGVTTAFEDAAALSARRLAPDAMHVNAYIAAALGAAALERSLPGPF